MSEELFESNATNFDGARRDGQNPSDKSNNERPRFVRRERIEGGHYNNYGADKGSNYGERRGNSYGRSYNRSSYGHSAGNNNYGGDRYRNYNNAEEGSSERPYRQHYSPRNSGRWQQNRNYQGYNPNRDNQNGFDNLGEGYSSENRYGKRSPYAANRYGNNGPRQNYGSRYNGGGERNSYHSQDNRQGYGNNAGGFARRKPSRPGYDPHAKYSLKKRLEYKEQHFDPNEPVRLNKFLANAGVCSRRDADKFITSGVVKVNGEVVTELGTKVLRSDSVLFHDQPVKMEKKVYVLLNKPKGYVTTSEDPQNRKTVMDLVREACPERIYPVGRLDRNTTGVLLFTNDGELASKLTHPKFLKKKIYHVTLDQNVSATDIRQIAEGITLEDGEIKADAVEYASPTDKKQVGIEIHSGKNRIVRRIFEHLGYHVTKLDRVYFAGLTKKNVRRGDWRYLTEKEVDMLRMGAFE